MKTAWFMIFLLVCLISLVFTIDFLKQILKAILLLPTQDVVIGIIGLFGCWFSILLYKNIIKGK